MVDAPERGSDEARPQEKGNRVKGNANTLRTEEFIAQFGKAARYPVCQAALHLWQLDAELLRLSKDIGVLAEITSSAKNQKKQAQALLDWFYDERREKDAIDAGALVRTIDDHLKKTQESYQANFGMFTIKLDKFRPLTVAQFKREYDAVVGAKDTKAIKALQRVHKQWSANPNATGARLKDGDKRTLEVLKMHRDKVIKATWAKDGPAAAYWEAGSGGDRALSDEVWSGRFTNREIYSHLSRLGGPRLAGDKEGKEIRRTTSRLGIRPAEDQRGRKWKPPVPKKQERKRPGITKPKITRMTEAMLAKTAEQGDGLRNKQIYEAGDERGLKWARQVIKSMDSEIKRLSLRRGGRKGQFVY